MISRYRVLMCLILSTVCMGFGGGNSCLAQVELRLPVTRDIWFSSFPREMNANLGGAARMKLKSIQEMSMVDFDPASIEGRVVKSATLHVKHASGDPLRRVTVGTFAAPWVEGTSKGYSPQDGSSCFDYRVYPEKHWTGHGGDLSHVVLSEGGTFWNWDDATPPDPQGWQEIEVDPRVLMARGVGISEGLFLFDDTGSEWEREGEEFTYHLFPNRYIFSTDQNQASAPYLTVELGEKDKLPPEPPSFIAPENPKGDQPYEISQVWPGTEIFRWTTPPDRGPAGTIGFRVEIDGQSVPQYLVPAASDPGEPVIFRLVDLPVSRGEQEHTLSVRAMDGAGNASEAIECRFVRAPLFDGVLPGTFPKPFPPEGVLPELDGAKVAVVDAFDKVSPISGEMIPPQSKDYRRGNHLFSADSKKIRLAAAKNEFCAFQMIFEGEVAVSEPKLTFSTKGNAGGEALTITFRRFHHVATPAGPLPDPVVPLSAKGFQFPRPPHDPEGARFGALLCEIQVPKDFPAGLHRGQLELHSSGDKLSLEVDLWIWQFALPDRLGFLPEMNCYGLPQNEVDYYRLAHRHRTVLNRVPYSQNGTVSPGCAPKWNGSTLEWESWDERFGPLLDGSAFDDLPRSGVPLECFYLPLHENWPSSMEENYNGSYWADEAFPESYREAFVSASRQFAEHFRDKGYMQTIFHCYLNNKNNFKRSGGWSRGSSPWLLDEPASFQDYWALRYFALAFEEGVQQARASSPAEDMQFPLMWFRGDVSRPQWQRETLDGLQEYAVLGGGAFRKYNRMILFRKEEEQTQLLIPYGSSNQVEHSNTQPVAWCLDSFVLGGNGVIPWQTVGRHESWEKGDALSLFYPGSKWGESLPYPSIRLKAYRRGQQDVEYALLLCQAAEENHLPRCSIRRMIGKTVPLKGEHRATDFTGGEDAGVTRFDSLKPQDLWKLRIRMARAVEGTLRP